MAEDIFDYEKSVGLVQDLFKTWRTVTKELLGELARAKAELNKGRGNPGERYTWKQFVEDCFGGKPSLKTVNRWLDRTASESEAFMVLLEDLDKSPKEKRETPLPRAYNDLLVKQVTKDKFEITFTIPEYEEFIFDSTLKVPKRDKTYNTTKNDTDCPLSDSEERRESYLKSRFQEIRRIKERIEKPERDLRDGKKFTFGTEFSGYGGSSIGLEQAGGRGLFALEWDKEVCDVFKDNFADHYPKGCIFRWDIKDFDGNKYLQKTGLKVGQLDVFQSSAPCQGFSKSNNDPDKVDDPKNELFFKSIAHVSILLPRICIFENVEGMLEPDNQPIFTKIVGKLCDVGYNVRTWVLEAGDYGAPQTRPRVFIIGFRKDLHIHPKIPRPLGEPVEINNKWFGIPYLQGHQQAQYARRLYPPQFPAGTITRTRGISVLDGRTDEIRLPTTEETRVLSTFPKDYKFRGDDTKDHAGLGNSVLPLQMQVLAEYLVPLANGEKPHSWGKLMKKMNATLANSPAHQYQRMRLEKLRASQIDPNDPTNQSSPST